MTILLKVSFLKFLKCCHIVAIYLVIYRVHYNIIFWVKFDGMMDAAAAAAH